MCGWKDIGMTIRRKSVVSFLPCLVAFLGFHPTKCSFVTCFWGSGEKKGIVVVAQM